MLEANADKDKANQRWRHPFVHRSSGWTVGGCNRLLLEANADKDKALDRWCHPFVHRS